jgi:hypothetical protein
LRKTSGRAAGHHNCAPGCDGALEKKSKEIMIMSKINSDVKVFGTRDSATACLKKIGVKRSDYNLFIEKKSNKIFECQIAKAEAFVKPAAAAPKATEPEASKKNVSSKAPRVSVASFTRSLILEGKSNDAVWMELKKQFQLQEDKKHYPSWYRSEMKRKGLIK